MSLPAADDLFRPTSPTPESAPESSTEPAAGPATGSAAGSAETAEGRAPEARRPSGRVRHDEKMTVYVTSHELLDLEHARLQLRRTHGLAVDRGRLVRAAVALALADLEDNGDESALLQRLRES